ncbi:hypothetical protein NDU88_005155 [Pleurodeles waltl]|uniref:Uncharacterized protein n=1 Tax=Pleurodeles waltl TaxID=8319 RepID=A0AAV7MVJ6_PLEWA|nr:hypothetical protein NDU88_005155 [Pleurodeles waltl]
MELGGGRGPPCRGGCLDWQRRALDGRGRAVSAEAPGQGKHWQRTGSTERRQRKGSRRLAAKTRVSAHTQPYFLLERADWSCGCHGYLSISVTVCQSKQRNEEIFQHLPDPTAPSESSERLIVLELTGPAGAHRLFNLQHQSVTDCSASLRTSLQSNPL